MYVLTSVHVLDLESSNVETHKWSQLLTLQAIGFVPLHLTRPEIVVIMHSLDRIVKPLKCLSDLLTQNFLVDNESNEANDFLTRSIHIKGAY